MAASTKWKKSIGTALAVATLAASIPATAVAQERDGRGDRRGGEARGWNGVRPGGGGEARPMPEGPRAQQGGGFNRNDWNRGDAPRAPEAPRPAPEAPRPAAPPQAGGGFQGQPGGWRGGHAVPQPGQPAPAPGQGWNTGQRPDWNGNRPGDGRPGDGRPDWNGNRPGDGRPGWQGNRPGDGRPGDGRPDWNGNRPGDGRPGDGRPGWQGNRPGDGRPGWSNDRGPAWNGNRPGWNNGRGPSWQGNRPGWNDDRGRWRNDWRQDRRYDWRGWRDSHRDIFRGPRYFAPFPSYRYSRLNIGIYLGAPFFAQQYWIADPWAYRLPPADPPYRWVRYYDDVLLIDTYTGQVVDVIYDFFW